MRLREEAQSFERLGAFAVQPIAWDGPTGWQGVAVTPSVFSVLRVAPRLGQLFGGEGEVDAAGRVVLLGHRAWLDRFGGDPGIIGASIELNYEPHTVIGVLPEGFHLLDGRVQFWTRLAVSAGEEQNGRAVVTIGRLRSGVSAEQAAAEVQTVIARSRASQATGLAEFGARVIRLSEMQGARAQMVLVVLGAATGLVLSMVCANIAGLLMVRGFARRRELAIRAAVGARPGRLMRQLLLESIALSVVGGVAGVGLAAGMVRVGVALAPGSVPGLGDVRLDGGAFLFAGGLSVITGLAFGVLPSVLVSRIDLMRILNQGGSAPAGGFGRLRAHGSQVAPVVVQVALAVVLVVSAGLLLRSFLTLVTRDLGLESAGVVIATVTSPERRAAIGGRGRVGPPTAEEATGTYSVDSLLMHTERIAALPGIEAAALSSTMPLFPSTLIKSINVAGQPIASDPRNWLMAAIRTVSAGYADVLGLRLRAGRFFTDDDTAGGPRVAVVSELFARRAFGGARALGQHLLLDGNETWEVIGVVADATPVTPAVFWEFVDGEIYLSMRQRGVEPASALGSLTLGVRAEGDPLSIVPLLRDVLADTDSWTGVSATLDDVLSGVVVQPRFLAICALAFAAVGLLLAAFGLYGVINYSVQQRRCEIAVRVALGAGGGDIMMLVLRQGGAVVAAGVILGLLVTVATTRVVASFLFGVTSADPVSFVAGTAVVLAAALLACWVPARRAARVYPMTALREA